MNKWVAALIVGGFSLSAVVGTIADPQARNTPFQRGGYTVLEGDFHAHTRFSDGFLSPFGLVRQANRRGLDVLAITEHNVVFPAYMGQWYASLTNGPTVLLGEEVTSGRYHIIAVGLQSRVLPESSVEKVIDAIHEQGGIAIAAHPVKQFWPALLPVRSKFDGTELMHPIALSPPRGPQWRWQDMLDYYEQSTAEGRTLAAIGSSDFHFFSTLGICRTYVFSEANSPDAIMKALRDRKTVVQDPTGKFYGPSELTSLLEADPPALHDWSYSYQATGLLDQFGRFVGLLSVFGLVFFRVSNNRKTEISSSLARRNYFKCFSLLCWRFGQIE